MLSLSPVTEHQGEHYYSHDNYYSDDQSVANSEWQGLGAEELSLAGSVKTEDFKQLLKGMIPTSNQPLIPKHDNAGIKHRSALDLTFSAPKSVSIAALINGDTRLEQAHQEAVSYALAVVENRYSTTRIGSRKNRRIEESQNLIVAKFHHDMSRALDPQIHTHCVVMNAIKRSDGNWRAWHTDAIYRHSKLVGMVYQNELAKRAQSLGYEIVRKDNGTFELAGFDQDLIQIFSKRRAQIEKFGGDQKENRIHVKKNRPAKQKEVDRQSQQAFWKEEIRDKHTLNDVPSNKNKPEIVVPDMGESYRHASAKEVYFIKEKAESFLLEHNLGNIDFNEIADHFSQSVRQQELIPVDSKNYTTQEALEIEKNILRIRELGVGKHSPIHEDIDVSTFDGLTRGQIDALKVSLSSKDQYFAWQGVAGAGKTYALNLLQQIAKDQGYEVKGFAPSAQAAKVLSDDANISTETVASHLLSQEPSNSQKKLWIVDEASLLDCRDCNNLMQKADSQNARVIFIGDTKQLSGVGAGNPFKLLQTAGIETAYLNESRRQKRQDIKVAVDLFRKGDIEGFKNCIANKIQVIENDKRRTSKIASDYLQLSKEERKNTLVLAGTNKERRLLTEEIRTGLKNKNQITQTRDVMCLTQVDLTAPELRHGQKLKPGQFISFHSKPEIFEIKSIDQSTKTVTLTNSKGDVQRFNPKTNSNFSVYALESSELGVGDNIRWTKNDKHRGLRNGQDGIVTALSTQKFTVSFGKLVHEFPIDQPLHLAHNFVTTIYSSQGKTSDRVLIATDQTISKQSMYVAISRAKYDFMLYTKNKNTMKQLMIKNNEKLNATTKVNEFAKLTTKHSSK